jgi:hypothetical protein
LFGTKHAEHVHPELGLGLKLEPAQLNPPVAVIVVEGAVVLEASVLDEPGLSLSHATHWVASALFEIMHTEQSQPDLVTGLDVTPAAAQLNPPITGVVSFLSNSVTPSLEEPVEVKVKEGSSDTCIFLTVSTSSLFTIFFSGLTSGKIKVFNSNKGTAHAFSLHS